MLIYTGSGIKGLVQGMVISIPTDIYVIWNDFFDGATVDREEDALTQPCGTLNWRSNLSDIELPILTMH